MNWTAVITTHNNVRYTALAVASLRSAYPDIPIVIVDNNSSDETETWARRLVKLRGNCTYVDNRGPRNLARSWNLGVAAAKTRFVLVCNNDLCFTEGFLEPLEKMIERPDIGVAFPAENNKAAKWLGYTGGPQEQAERMNEAAEDFRPASILGGEMMAALAAWWNGILSTIVKTKPKYVDRPYYDAGGFCFAVDMEKHAVIGDFDEHTFQFWGEDWDYFARALRRYKLAVVPNSFVWHFESRTSNLVPEKFDALMASRFRLFEKHEGAKEVVSVVIPNKERIEELRVAVRSVMAQSYPHWRIYVIDDGSERWVKIGQMLESLNDPRIGMWHLEKSVGPSGARNYGIERAEGKYIALLDSDDKWMPRHLETHVRYHETHECDMTYSDAGFAWRWWDKTLNAFIEQQAPLPTVRYYGPFDRERLEKENYIITSSTVWWAQRLKELRFCEDMRFEEDWEICRRVPGNVFHIGEQTLRYHQQPKTNNLMEENGAIALPDRPDVKEYKAMKMTFRGTRYTVVIPTRNRPDLLGRAVASCGEEVPIIVVDDASDDPGRTVDAVRQNRNVRVVSSPSRGPSAARNLGVALATTQWIKFCDDDDLLVNGWLPIFENVASVEQLASVLTNDAAAAHRNGNMVILGAEEIFTSQMAVRRSDFLAVGGFEDSRHIAEERDLLKRMEEAGMGRHHIGTVLTIKSRLVVLRGGPGKPEERPPSGLQDSSSTKEAAWK